MPCRSRTGQRCRTSSGATRSRSWRRMCRKARFAIRTRRRASSERKRASVFRACRYLTSTCQIPRLTDPITACTTLAEVRAVLALAQTQAAFERHAGDGCAEHGAALGARRALREASPARRRSSRARPPRTSGRTRRRACGRAPAPCLACSRIRSRARLGSGPCARTCSRAARRRRRKRHGELRLRRRARPRARRRVR